MGAWGTDSFDNDTACDWAIQLEEADDLGLVESAIAAVIDSGDEYIDADAGCEAVAACEVIARLRGGFGVRNSYTETVDAWVASHPQAPPAALVQRAQKALDRVVQPDSELRELWDEVGSADWLRAVEALRRRLS